MRNILILVGIVAILMGGTYLSLSFYAVKLIQPQIQKAINPEITLSDMEVRVTHLSLKKIQYEEQSLKRRIFKIEEIKVYPSLLSLLRGHLRVKEIVLLKPSFFFFRSHEGRVLTPLTGISGKGGKGDNFREERKSKSLSLKIDHISILNGSIDFEDQKIGDPPAKVNLRELDIKIEVAEFPFVQIPLTFKMNGKIKENEKEGLMKIEGLLNPETVEFESFLTLREIGVKVFEPYYRKRVSAKVEDGWINIEAKLMVRRRVIDIHGDMELAGLQIKGSEGKVFWIPADLFSTQFNKKGGHLKIPFHIKGDLDDPKFNLQESILIHLALSLGESLGMPVKIFRNGNEEIRKSLGH